MSVELVKYRQSLNREEVSFLRRKEEKDRKQIFRIARVFMILCFVCPFIVAWFRAFAGHQNPFSIGYYFLGVFFLVCFSLAGLYWGYYHNLRKLRLDLKHRTKTIERAFITRKQYMPSNDSYFFYLTSAVKLSIEVAEYDYRRLDKGDEVSIEYTTFSNMYLGYF
ncbi:MAG TPA: hypothetical protein PL009_04975 [Flavipsychrobacter sp.]|nr:hypothetical protein [Flavipsychrobacter sp.]